MLVRPVLRYIAPCWLDEEGDAVETCTKKVERLCDTRKKSTAAEGGMLVGRTFRTESSSNVRFGWRNVGQTQSSLIKVLVGKEVSQTHTGRLG